MYGFLDQELTGDTGNTPSVSLEATRELPTLLTGDDTLTATDDHEEGYPDRQGHTADGSDTDRLERDSVCSEPKDRTDPLPNEALHQPVPLIDLEKWPHLPRYGGQDPLGPALQPLAMPWKKLTDTPRALPRAVHQTQKQQDTAIHSAVQAITPREATGLAAGASEPTTSATATNAPLVGQSTTAKSTLPRRQRPAKKPPKSSTACFSWDTYVLVEYQGFAMWKKFFQVQQGELAVQSLPSGNIMDLTGALLTPVKTLCYFDTKDGRIDLVYLGTSAITPNHHILMAEGWMAASQAADQGQGVIHSSKLDGVYNLCLEGGGNILINTSNQPDVFIFTSAATMGYLFTPASGSQQYSSLSYPEDIQTQLRLRQDLSYGYAHFRHGAVETLPNGGLIFDNATGDMPQKKARAPLLDKRLGDIRLKQSAPNRRPPLTTF